LPPEIGNLTNLLYLHVPSNQLSKLPLEMGDLNNLLLLVLNRNTVMELPPELCNYLTKSETSTAQSWSRMTGRQRFCIRASDVF
jgi:Leucine-rich repeat (LRR) protein